MTKKHYIHNIYMAEIANLIINDQIPLNEDAKILYVNKSLFQHGVKEIIGLYLLIPFINNEDQQLKYDEEHSQISIYSDDDIAFKDIKGREVRIRDLRDTICHSFVSCDLKVASEPVIVFDDRLIKSRVEHDKLANTSNGSECVFVKNDDVLEFLKKSFKLILSLYEEK